MSYDIIQKIKRRLHSLEQERRTWEGQWQEISELILPSKGRFSGERENNGEKKHTKIVDSTAIHALRTLAAGMHGGLSSPARPWFRLGLKEKEDADIQGVGLWLQEAQEKVHSVLASSNFYPCIHSHYAELAGFGTGVFLIEEDEDEIIRCRNLTIGEYYLDVDAKGRVNTLYRRFYLTAEQIYERFGSSCPHSIREAIENYDTKRYEIIHAIEPRKKRNAKSYSPLHKAFASYYLLIGYEECVLEEDGYDEFPACCPRWDVTAGNIYGHGPGMDALPDVAMLQRMRADGLDALELEIKPPMNVSNSIRNQGGQFSLRPGFANFVDTNSPSPAISPTYQVRANLQALDSYLQQIRNQINEHFYKDLFLLLSQSDKRMTATEVLERNAEKLIMLGPTLERLRSELFQPLIQRVFGIMSRRGLIRIPKELEGQEWELEMISGLALAQKSSDITAIRDISSYVGTIAGVRPEVLDLLDADEMVRHTARLMGVPHSVLRGQDLVEEIRSQKSQEQQMLTQQQQQVEGLKTGVEMAEKLGKIDMTKDTMAKRIGEAFEESIVSLNQHLVGNSGGGVALPQVRD